MPDMEKVIEGITNPKVGPVSILFLKYVSIPALTISCLHYLWYEVLH